MEMTLNGKKVADYETDCFGMDKNEIDPAEMLFTYAEFENGRELTDNQLDKLSKKYPEVLYNLLRDDIPKDSPIHARYQLTAN